MFDPKDLLEVGVSALVLWLALILIFKYIGKRERAIKEAAIAALVFFTLSMIARLFS